VPSNPERRPLAESEPAPDAIRDATTRKADLACDGILKAHSTTFAKLVNLAGLRAAGSDVYSHPQLAPAFPPALVTLVLQKRHETTFADWINLSLEEQHKQLTEFFCTMWTRGTPRLPLAVRHALVPASAREAERLLFLADLECMLSVMEVGES
jgi:hypothetical protein